MLFLARVVYGLRSRVAPPTPTRRCEASSIELNNENYYAYRKRLWQRVHKDGRQHETPTHHAAGGACWRRNQGGRDRS